MKNRGHVQPNRLREPLGHSLRAALASCNQLVLQCQESSKNLKSRHGATAKLTSTLEYAQNAAWAPQVAKGATSSQWSLLNIKCITALDGLDGKVSRSAETVDMSCAAKQCAQ